MKKKYILVAMGIVLLILAASWYKQQSYTCGDGVCHKEEFAKGICAQDCGTNTLSIPDVGNSNQPQECQIKSIVKLGEGSFPKFSPDGKSIAFNKLVNNVYEIFTMRPDGTEVKCLTCGKTELPPNGHKGQPYWHPNGEYLVFSAQNTNYKLRQEGYAEQPDAGRSHNVWIMDKDGNNFWQMTDYPENWGVIKPAFSNAGTKIFWNEEYMMEKYPHGKWTDVIPHPGSYWSYANFIFRKGEELGIWRVVYADLAFKDKIPSISNIKKINPPPNHIVIEISGFTADDKGFLISFADLKRAGGKDMWGDIYTTNITGGDLKQLTFSVYNHDENAEYSPDGKKIAWSSSPGLPGTGGVDIYLMEANGENKAQLTHFGEKANTDYLGDDYSCREPSWSPNGSQIAVSFGTNYRPYIKDQSYYFDNLYLITFEGACGKL